MLTIRTKFTLVLLMMSLLVVAALGLSVRWLIVHEFEALVTDRAMTGFMREIGAYYREYGSWQLAREAESFQQFTRRTQGHVLRRERADWSSGPMARAGSARLQAPSPRPEGPPRKLALGRNAPGIAVVDERGRALLPLAGLEPGQEITRQQLRKGRPILVDGRQVGLALVLSTPPMTEIDLGYLDAIQQSWLYASLVALVLALPVGVLLGGHFTRPILSLKQAMSALQQGRLGQSVEVRSDDELGQLSAAFNRMSLELADSHEQLRELSRRDELTQLPNRRAFDEGAQALLAQSRRIGFRMVLALADIDYFKRINDEYSHSVGDSVLRRVAGLLKDNLREVDLVARYGGEEFVFLFPQAYLPEAGALCERLRAVVEACHWEDIAPGLRVTLSIGLAEHEQPRELEETLRLADEKLYEAKARGRNRIRY